MESPRTPSWEKSNRKSWFSALASGYALGLFGINLALAAGENSIGRGAGFDFNSFEFFAYAYLIVGGALLLAAILLLLERSLVARIGLLVPLIAATLPLRIINSWRPERYPSWVTDYNEGLWLLMYSDLPLVVAVLLLRLSEINSLGRILKEGRK